MYTRNIPGGWGETWPSYKNDNITAIWETIVYKMWDPRRLPQPYGPPRPVTGIPLVLFSLFILTDYFNKTFINYMNFLIYSWLMML
jgi:hypothetical protein